MINNVNAKLRKKYTLGMNKYKGNVKIIKHNNNSNPPVRFMTLE